MVRWGNGENGQLGHGNQESCCKPQQVNYFSYYQICVIQVAAGDYHSVCLTHHGGVYLFGRNQFGQLVC